MFARSTRCSHGSGHLLTCRVKAFKRRFGCPPENRLGIQVYACEVVVLLRARVPNVTNEHRGRTLRGALAILVTAVLLPLVAAGASFLVHQWTQQREAAITRLRDESRTLRQAVDREFALDRAVLNALATSRDIDTGDWRAFDDAARQAAARARPGSWFVLYDETGQAFVNTNVPYGSPLPNYRKVMSVGAEVEWNGRTLPMPGAWQFAPFDTHEPVFSGIFFGPVGRRPVITTAIPVMRGGRARYVLGVAYSSEFLARVLQKEDTPDVVNSAIFDASGRFIARNRDSERYVGSPGPEPFRGGVARLAREGIGEALNVESIPLVYAYSRSTVADVVVAVGMPKAAVLAPAWRALWLWLGVLVTAATIGGYFAFRLWRRVGTPLAALARQADVLGKQDVEIPPAMIEEVDAVRVALLRASDAVAVRDRAEESVRRAAELLEHGDGFVELDRDWVILRVNAAQERATRKLRSETIGRVFWQVWPEAENTKAAREYRRAMDERVAVQFEDYFEPLDTWFAISVYPTTTGGIAVFFRDVTDRKRAEVGLLESEERYRTLFTNMTEGFALGEAIIGADGQPSDFRFLEMNEAFERQSGLDRDAIRGRPIREVLPRVEQSWIDTYCGVALGAPPRRFENYNRDLDRHFSVYCFSPARGRFAIIFSDVTERTRAEEAAHRAAEQLREADRRKDEFLGMLSHELRNPLAPIRNSLYILDRADPQGQQARRAKEVANRQVAHLTRLVDDLLDVTRIARGKIELRRADVDVAALAKRTAEDHRAVMEDRHLHLEVRVSDCPVLVNGDETRLAQVLGNLLHNAAKFTPGGGRVSLLVREEDGRAVLRVSDTGPGIPPDVLPTIFEPFTQAKQTLARSEGGLGLGLALVKGLVGLHGGEVAVNSATGSGTEFVVNLPLAAQRARTRSNDAADPGTARGPRRRVLVIDDNRDAAESLAQLVEMFGHDVEVAFDAFTGLGKASKSLPDVVLCDIGLPGMDGYEFARQLRSLSAPRAVRLVAVSGYAQTDDVEKAAEAGFDGHVAKPPDPAEIERLLA